MTKVVLYFKIFELVFEIMINNIWVYHYEWVYSNRLSFKEILCCWRGLFITSLFIILLSLILFFRTFLSIFLILFLNWLLTQEFLFNWFWWRRIRKFLILEWNCFQEIFGGLIIVLVTSNSIICLIIVWRQYLEGTDYFPSHIRLRIFKRKKLSWYSFLLAHL